MPLFSSHEKYFQVKSSRGENSYSNIMEIHRMEIFCQHGLEDDAFVQNSGSLGFLSYDSDRCGWTCQRSARESK